MSAEAGFQDLTRQLRREHAAEHAARELELRALRALKEFYTRRKQLHITASGFSECHSIESPRQEAKERLGRLGEYQPRAMAGTA